MLKPLTRSWKLDKGGIWSDSDDSSSSLSEGMGNPGFHNIKFLKTF